MIRLATIARISSRVLSRNDFVGHSYKLIPRRMISMSKINFEENTKFNNKDKREKKIKYKNKKNGVIKKVKKDLSYEEESDNYLLRELTKSQLEFTRNNQQIDKIVKQFKETFALYGIEISNGPFNEINNIHKGNENCLHLIKNFDNNIIIDILVDCGSRIYTDKREIQVLINDLTNDSHLLYLMGNCDKMDGFLFNSCLIINKNSILDGNKDISLIRNAICNGENWIFEALSNVYEKRLDVDNSDVRKFLLFLRSSLVSVSDDSGTNTDLPDLEGRLLVDGLINYFINDIIHRDSYNQHDKILGLIDMFSLYCENLNRGKWLNGLVSFIGKSRTTNTPN